MKMKREGQADRELQTEVEIKKKNWKDDETINHKCG